MRNLWHSVFHYEYWPWWLFFIPLLPMYLLAVLVSRKLLYFTAVNPKIYMGGFFGERKNEIMALIPESLKPKEVYIQKGEEPTVPFRAAGMQFPCFVKPNVGERGFEVKELHSLDELLEYHQKGFDYVIQEKLMHEREFGILAYRLSGKVVVSSICEKEFMAVTGDGVHSVEWMIKRDPRYRRYLPWLREEFAKKLQYIPDVNEWVVVHQIGNHCKGTRFLDRTSQVNAAISSQFQQILEQVEGLDYVRFDLKADSLEAIARGDFKVFEVNGVSSEPGDMYSQPQVFAAYRILYQHWWTILKISKANIKKGVKTTPFFQFVNQISNHFFT